MQKLSRRQLMLVGGAGLLAAADPFFETKTRAAENSSGNLPFRYSLNFGTLIGFKLPLEEEIDVAAKAGYAGIEPWTRKLDEFQKKGGKLSDLRKRIADHGLSVVGGCAFFPWIVDDDEKRIKGIEQMKREMDWLREIGGTRIAATAAGATEKRLDDFKVLGERYRTILEIGDQHDVLPQLEIWGKVKTLNCLADALAIGAHAGHPKTEFLLDIFHLYKGGTPFESLGLLNGRRMTNFHVHDYPADPPREAAEDKDRVYPGDGVAPLRRIFEILKEIEFRGYLSFEVFNPTYWATNDPLLVAKTGLEKLKKVVEN